MVDRVQSEAIKQMLKVYFIFGSINCPKKPEDVLADAIAGGITIFQFREKGTDALKGAEKQALALELQKICRNHQIPFIVNDDVDLALLIDADGVHVGQDDENVATVRERIGADKILGVSAHSLEEVETAISCGADYLGIGPVFETKTKEDAKAAAGVTLIQTLRQTGFTIPIVGIGGINSDNAGTVMEAGADGVAVITAISLAESVADAAKQIRNKVEEF
jgi:thiamine-phosphate pyrophosphorylase